eukprot:SAG22_NODE_811_length_7061_cov_84.983338_3_plen_202_part_00
MLTVPRFVAQFDAWADAITEEASLAEFTRQVRAMIAHASAAKAGSGGSGAELGRSMSAGTVASLAATLRQTKQDPESRRLQELYERNQDRARAPRYGMLGGYGRRWDAYAHLDGGLRSEKRSFSAAVQAALELPDETRLVGYLAAADATGTTAHCRLVPPPPGPPAASRWLRAPGLWRRRLPRWRPLPGRRRRAGRGRTVR